jgi:hypothetical protein
MSSYLPPTLSHDDFVALLEQRQFEVILVQVQGYIEEKVRRYLRNFPAYKADCADYCQEVHIHLLTKTLPNASFLRACQQYNTFQFYLAKSIRNCLNTLLTKEMKVRQNMTSLDYQQGQDENDYQEDKNSRLIDHSYQYQTDTQDLFARLKHRLDSYLADFEETFPRITHKLRLLLKLNGRAVIAHEDLQACFPQISTLDIQQLYRELGHDEEYRQKEDIRIYEIICPYFQHYRKEKGNAAALQRWLNLHITGDEQRKGILVHLEIREAEDIWRIQDKKLFADFLHIYFKSTVTEKTVQFEPGVIKTNGWQQWKAELKALSFKMW